MARLIGNVDATGSLTTSIPGTVTNSSAVSLYSPFDSNINDTSDHSHTGTAIGNATISSTQAKFGSNSAYFDGSGDAITYPRDTAFQFASGDFTIEAFVYRTSSPSYGVIAAMWTGSGNRRSFIFRFNGNNPYFYWSTSGNSSYSSQAFTDLTASLNTWHHVAFVRFGSSGFCFLDGVKSSNTANLSTNTLYYPDAPLSIGALNTLSHSGGQNNFAGYIDDLRITKGLSLYTRNFVTPSQAVGASLSGANETISGSNLTSLYLPFDSDINDDGPGSHTVTAVGDAAVSSTQSKFGGSSLYLDGNGDRLNVSSDVYDEIRTSDFTIEMFFYPTTISNARLWSQYEGSGNRPLLIQTQSAGNVQLYIGDNSGAQSITASNVLSVNTWYHVAVTRIGSTVTLYFNGTSYGSLTISGDLNTFNNSISIGARNNNASPFEGYIDDLRVVKHGIYTGDFTPPTSALTTSSSQTRNDLAVLYLPFDSGVADKARGHPVTAYGNAAISATQAKFGGKSLSLDGTGDYLDIPDNSFHFGTNDFTVECWLYHSRDSQSSQATFLDFRNSSSNGFSLTIDANGRLGVYSAHTGNLISASSSTEMSKDAWHHFAYCRSGTTGKMFVDGTELGSATDNANYASTSLRIGARYTGNTQYYVGYIDDILISKTAKYTSAFTAPSAASGGEVTTLISDTRTFSSVWNLNSAVVAENFKAGNWPTIPLDTQYTRLYLPYDSDANDDSSNAYTASSSNHGSSGSISSTQAKFGGNSAYFSSANAGYRYGTGGAFDLGSNNFTIRFWLYKTSANGAFLDYRSGSGGSGSGNESYGWLVHPNGFYFAGVGWPMMSFSDLADNQWQHIAVTRSGSSFYLFVDGVQQGSTVTSSNANGSSSGNAVLQVGAQYDSSYGLTGYIDDLQIDVGYAAYTAAFTPPSSPHGGGV